MIETDNKNISIERQCELLCLSRASYYYQAAETDVSKDEELIQEMKRIHELFPYMGSRRIREQLIKHNYKISRKKVASLMTVLKISAIYPKPNLSMPNKMHKKYPYLLKGLEIIRPNQVWCTDITYIKIGTGFMYLTAIIDVYSRFIVAWEISNSLSKDFCINVVKKALKIGKPEILNTDQGVQYTSNDFIELLETNNIKISMDSKGRALDNVWIERFWRNVKYEEIYLKEYQSTIELYQGIRNYIEFYNNGRGHQSLDYKEPIMVYHKKMVVPSVKVA